METHESDSLHPYSNQSITEIENDALNMDVGEAADVDKIPLLDSSDGGVLPQSSGLRSVKDSPAQLKAALDCDTQLPGTVHALKNQVLRFREEMTVDEDASEKMTAYRDRVSLELEDLTAALFEEANKMVRDEKVKRHHAEQLLIEANMKLEALQAETTWRRSQMSISPAKHTPPRSASIHDTGSLSHPLPNFDQSPKPPAGIIQWLRSLSEKESDDVSTIPLNEAGDGVNVRHKETDPIVHREFVQWRERPSLDRELPLIRRIYRQEIEPNFEFINADLAAKALKAVVENTIVIEEGDKFKPFSRECSLSVAPRNCQYRMKICDVWYPISAFARNRIITVCDFVTYVRYIQSGLVNRGVHDTWWEIVRLRERMCQARLGIL